MISVRQVVTLTIFLLGFGALFFAGAQQKPAKTPPRISTEARYSAPPAMAPDVQRRVETFEKVWQTIRDDYFDTTFNNLDWNAIRTEYEPQVRASKSDQELYKLLRTMINRLERSHLAIIPPEVFAEIEKARVDAKLREQSRRSKIASTAGNEAEDEEPLIVDDPLAQYGTGIHLQIIDGKFVISRLDNNAAAEYAGLKTGYVIDSINDVSLTTLLTRLQIHYADVRNIRRYLPYQIVKYFLNGEKDSQVKIGYLDEKDVAKSVLIRRELMRTQTVSVGPNFPDAQLVFQSSSISPDIGYVRFDLFAYPVIEKFCDVLTEFKDKKALVVDLRGNLGGSLATVIGLAGMLSDNDLILGTSIYRSGPEILAAQSKAKHFKGRVVILVDGLTASAAEMLSSALQESGHAIVVGDKTAGETLPAVTVELPTGARLLYPIANYKSSSGKLLEGNGVVPDRIVSLDRASLLNGRDVQMDAALRLIEEESKNAKLQTLASAPPDYRGPMSTGLGGAAPPPPPPRRKFTVAGDGRGITGSSATKTTELSPARDARAVKVIDEFLALATPKDSVSVLKTYEMSGKLELSMKGVKQLFDYKAFGDMPGNKYSEITSSAMTGEIRSINDGKLIHVQTDFGVDRKLPVLRETSSETEYFLPAIRVREVALFPKINYLGVFDRNGRKVHLIEARSANGASVALGFDVSTKMLASLASNYSTIGYDDFRKVGDFLMPFHVENGMVTKIDLTGVKINTTIDPAAFLPKERCFDKP